MTRVCVVGAGAIGGWIGARLAASKVAEVSVVARGATLTSLRERGWQLRTADGTVTAPARAAADAGELGEQDVVILTVKAPALAAAVRHLPPLLGKSTVVVPFMNGVPWWFGRGTVLGDEPLRSVDPGGVVAAAVDVGRVLGGVVHSSCSSPEPGVVEHVMGNGLIVGEPAGGGSARADAVGDLLGAAGFTAVVSADVRYDIWYKLWGNMTINPVSALTGATADRILADPLVRDFCSAAMREAAAIGRRLGCDIEQTPEDRHQVTARLGAFSMLQDAEAGRPLELDALVGAVHEMGERLGLPTPYIGALLGLSRLAASR
ncbi:2-dehydropantoate 2-reductase [Actinoplanes sp. NPDC051633]|uniref:2-dehydropantoate 2-reductase n=1 Tax=Actinoplanes sp. NPDC051633 TaxID=3155670 RepID=UPI003437A39C